jgi:hypothetical protein
MAIDNARDICEVFVLGSIERFGQPIGSLVLRGNFRNHNSVAVYLPADAVIANVHMLSPGIGAGWLAKTIDSRLIVFTNNDSALLFTEDLRHQTSQSGCLLCSNADSNILSLCGTVE